MSPVGPQSRPVGGDTSAPHSERQQSHLLLGRNLFRVPSASSETLFQAFLTCLDGCRGILPGSREQAPGRPPQPSSTFTGSQLAPTSPTSSSRSPTNVLMLSLLVIAQISSAHLIFGPLTPANLGPFCRQSSQGHGPRPTLDRLKRRLEHRLFTSACPLSSLQMFKL